MRIAIVSKSAFSHIAGGQTVPAVVSGHTSQLARALLTSAAADGHEVTHIYAAAPAPGDAFVVDPGDLYPPNVRRLGFWDVALPKSTLHSGALSFTAALTAAAAPEPLDWVVLLYTFPLAPLVQQFVSGTETRFAALLRGGDAYKWLDPHWWRRVHPESDGALMAMVYGDALRRANYLAAASEWLASVVRSRGLSCTAVLESPSAVWSGPLLPRAALLAAPGISVREGTIDPASKWLLWAGRASADKRPELALEAFETARLAGWSLLLAAVGPEEPRIAAYIRSRRIPAVLISASPRMMPALFAHCDAFVHTAVPSDNFIDARPAAVTSAAYHAKPVIAPRADQGGVMESVAPVNREFFAFATAESPATDMRHALATVIRSLRDDALREKVGNANRDWAAASSPSRVWERLLAGLYAS